MSIWTIIPVKPLKRAKSRLAEIMPAEERYLFAQNMFRHVLSVVQSVPEITGTLVISRDNHALSIAREHGAKTIQESGSPELNAALTRATSVVASWRTDAILILPADLPLIQPEDVQGIIRLGQSPYSVVVATDRDRDGTNALFVRPPGLISYAYGPGSYHRHAVLARDAGAEVNTYETERLAQDIDLPLDVENYFRMVLRGGYNTTLDLSTFHSLQSELEKHG